VDVWAPTSGVIQVDDQMLRRVLCFVVRLIIPAAQKAACRQGISAVDRRDCVLWDGFAVMEQTVVCLVLNVVTVGGVVPQCCPTSGCCPTGTTCCADDLECGEPGC
jgi:hypothetical protein